MSAEIETAGGGIRTGGTSTARPEVRRVAEALSDKQQRALSLVTEGKPIQQVGEAVGVDRGTIYRWMRTDPHFRAAYNAWQLEQRESYRAALLKCAEVAVAKVSRMVDLDGNLAWKVVKELGLLSRSQTLNTDAKQVEQEIALEQLEANAQLAERHSSLMDDEAKETFLSIAQRMLGDSAAPQPAPRPGPSPAPPPAEVLESEADRRARNGKL